MMQKLKLKLIE